MNIINPKNIDDIELPEIIGLDTEFTSLDTKTARLLVISISDFEKKNNYGFDVSLYTREEILRLLKKVQACTLVLAHNAKAEIAIVFSNFGILLRNCWCTMMASQVVDNGYGYQIAKEKLAGTPFADHSEKIYFTKNMVGGIEMMPSPHGLYGVIRRYLKISLSETMDKKRMQRSFINHPIGREISKEQMDYAVGDVEFLYPLYIKQLEFISARGMEKQIEIENKLTPTLVKMEHRGCLVDKEKHRQNIKDWEEKLFDIERKLDKMIWDLSDDFSSIRGGKYSNVRRKEKVLQTAFFEGHEKVITNENKNNVNYSSSKQIQEIFERINLPFPKDDDGKTSFGEEPLKMYTTTYPESILRPFLDLILEHREYSKLLSTYGENLLQLLDNDGRMRTNYTQCFTDTGRLTSSAIIKDYLGLNLANIPKRGDIRSIFIPDEGYSFIDSDMTGQELITVASYSKEPILVDAFEKGFDHHSFLASISYSIIFGQKVEIKNVSENIKVDRYTYDVKKLRDVHKTALFAKIYKGGAKRLLNVLSEYLCNHVAPSQRLGTAERISKALDDALPAMTKFLDKSIAFTKKNGYAITTKLGRRRYFDHPEKVYGDAANFDIQSTGSMAIKVALINIDAWYGKTAKYLNIKEEELGWISMSIYDQNLCCLNDEYIDLAPQIQQKMAEALTFFLDGMKGKSDLNIRKFWSK